MKKNIKTLVLLVLAAPSLIGCSPSHFSGKWKFNSIADIAMSPNVGEDVIESYKEHYGVSDVAGIEAAALDSFKEEKLFNPCYINFSGKYTYTYDVIMEREATWVFFQTSENEGFLSFYSELDPSEGNPDPEIFPPLVYNPETDNMYMTYTYSAFNFSIEFVRQ
jgi:hypothetical protein